MKTLLLDTVLWDLVIDLKGDIAVASNPYALAQDAASAGLLHKTDGVGELYYDTVPGVPYDQILGKSPSLALFKAYFEAAALTVPGVASAKCIIAGVQQRTVTGQIQVTSDTGETAAVVITT